MAKSAGAAIRAICEAVFKRESLDAATVRVEFMGRLAAVISRTATRSVQKRLAKQRNGTTSDLPAVIVRQVSTAVEPDLNEDEELGIEGLRVSLCSSGLWLCSFSSVVRVFACRTLVVSIFWLRWGAERHAIDVTILPHLSWLSCLFASPPCVLVHSRWLFLACLKRKVWLFF